MAFLVYPRAATTAIVRPVLCLVVGTASLAGTSAASPAGKAMPDVTTLLVKSILAQYTVNYKGRQIEIVSDQGNGALHTTTRLVIHRKDGRSLVRCLDPPSLRGCFQADDGRWVRSYDPRTHLVTIGRSMARVRTRRDAQRMVRRILAAYRVSATGTDQVAQRECVILSLRPYDPYSHTINVWIDAGTGVTLSRQDNSPRGHTFSLTLFKSIAYPRTVSSQELHYTLPPGTRTQKITLSPLYHDVARLRRAAGFPILVPISMPMGFEFESAEMVRLNGVPNACLRYTDGMAGLTIFEKPVDRPNSGAHAPVLSRPLPRGEAIAMTVHGRMACIVVGAREPDGLMAILRALDPEREDELLHRFKDAFRPPPHILAASRQRGLGMDCLAALLDIARQTGRPLEALLALHGEGWEWPSLARRFRADLHEVEQHIKPYLCR
ncbi:MAG: sigma-E factor regulatory protein RseB domain-containing protein [Chthonomonadales bacterium]